MKNIIHKQRVLLNIPSQEQAFGFQNSISTLFKNELAHELDIIFDEIAPHQIIRLNTLQLNLGAISAYNFEQEFKERLIKQIKNEILITENEKIEENENIGGHTTNSLRDGLIHFLQLGSLPWYLAYAKPLNWEEKILKKFSDKDWTVFINWLQKNCRQYPVVFRRLVFQFSDVFLKQLLTKSGSLTSDLIVELHHDLAYLLFEFQIDNQTEIQNKIWQNFLQVYLIEKEEENAELILFLRLFAFKLSSVQLKDFAARNVDVSKNIRLKSIRTYINKLGDFVNSNKQSNSNFHTEESSNEGLKKSLVENFKTFSTDNTETFLQNKNLVAKEDATVPENEKLLNIGKLTKLLDEEADVENIEVVDDNVKKAFQPINISAEDAFYVSNSGAVLLHPFLEMYFTELGFIENKRFKDETLQARGVLLLHYLSTQKKEVAEFDLTLEKILCGFPLHETLPSQIILSEKEKKESDQLLQSVIAYWPSMKNTSIEGLQSSFLQREGKLNLTDTGWLLTVEYKTIDILLGKLPWGFSTIRLPWMKEILSVEW